MTKKNKWPVWIVPALVAAIFFIGNIAINLVTDDIKEKLLPYRYWIWGVLIIAFLTAVVWAIVEAKAKTPAEPPDSVFNQLDFNSRKKLIDAFLKCSSMSTKDKRSLIILQLPADIQHRIERFPGNIEDVGSIVATTMEFDVGINELLKIIAYFEGETRDMLHVKEIVSEVIDGSRASLERFNLPPIDSSASSVGPGNIKIIKDTSSSVLDKLVRPNDSDKVR